MVDDVDDDAGDEKNDSEWNVPCVQGEEHLRATPNFIVKDMERPLHTKEAAANTTTSAVFDSGEDYEEIKTLFRILLYEFP